MQEIELPNGDVLEFPDGMDDAAIASAVKQYMANSSETEESPSRSFLDRAADSVSQTLEGFTLGLSDEIQAGMGSLTGMGDYDELLAKSRGRTEEFKERNPYVAPGLEMAGGAALALTPVGMAGQAVAAPMKAANLGRAAAAGAGAGGVYGFNTGEGSFSKRLGNVPLNAFTGAVGGALGNVVQAGIPRAVQAFKGDGLDDLGRSLGLSPEARRLARSAAQNADADIAGGAVQHLRRGGQDAMIGDAMPGPLDYVTNVGQGAAIARRNLNARVDRASDQVLRATDDVLGAPMGRREVVDEIMGSTAQARSDAYGAAYAQPMDYASETGQKVEALLSRIDKRTLAAAAREAEEEMAFSGLQPQFLLDIGDDGAIRGFAQMPNMAELDYIKRGLDELAENATEFGKTARKGQRARAYARELRDLLADANPDYRQALEAGGDAISQRNARDLGQKMLASNTTVEDVVLGTQGMRPEDLARVKQGVRTEIEKRLGDVRRLRSGPVSAEQQQAWLAISTLTTPNNQAKLAAVLGDDEARAFISQLDEATRAFGVRASAAGNSATSGREAFRTGIKDAASRGRIPERPPRSILDEALSLPGRGVNALFGATPGRIAAREEGINRELAELLTGRTGQDAIDAFEMLLRQAQIPDAVARAGRLSQALGRVPRLAAAPMAAPLIQP